MAGQRIAPLLRQWRQERQLSQKQLAAQAGIDRSTLARWERSEHAPSVTELDAVLAALGVSTDERVQAFGTVAAPRAQKRLRRETSSLSLLDGVGPPVGGDLLRAMRLRRGKTQAEVASAIGVTRTTLTRWETSLTWPNTADLHALCWQLDAYPMEVAALTVGRFNPGALMEGTEGGAAGGAPTLDALLARIQRLQVDCSATMNRRMADLHYLAYIGGLWALGGPREPTIRPRLALVCAQYAQMLMDSGRLAESESYAHQALQLSGSPRQEDLTTYITSQLALAERDVYGDGLSIETRRNQTLSSLPARSDAPPPAFHFGRGIRRLRDLAESNLSPTFATWVLAHVARYHAGANRSDDAIRLAKKAYDVIAPEREERSMEIRARQQLWARILLRSGRAAEALALVPESAQPEPFALTDGFLQAEAQVQVEANLIRVEALLLLGKHHAAHDTLQHCRDGIIKNDWLHLMPQADLLTVHL